MMLLQLVTLVCMAMVKAAEVESFEWGGVFELVPGTFAWTASKTDEIYAAPSMKMVVLELRSSDFSLETETIDHDFEDMAANALVESSNCTDYHPGDDVRVLFSSDDTNSSASPLCVNLIFDSDIYTSIFPLVLGDGHEEEEEEGDHHHEEETMYAAIFTEHVPYEFENGLHYLKDSHGHDMEPLFEFGGGHGGDDDDESSKNRRGRAWKNSMLATFFVLCCTIVGALVRAPALWGGRETYAAFVENPFFTQGAAALSCGALLSCAVFLMLFESVHLTGSRWSEEPATWRFGSMILGGYGAGLFSSYFFEKSHHSSSGNTKNKNKNDRAGSLEMVDSSSSSSNVVVAEEIPDDEKRSCRAIDLKKPILWSLVFSITLGDFFHNFVDGMVIARAFLDCNASKGWTVAAATVYHELAQEISDFVLLVNAAGLGVVPALLVNVSAGFSVMLGAAVFMWTKPGDGGQGLLLAFAAGLYIYLATNVGAHQFADSNADSALTTKLFVLFCFLVGCVAIGLVLLDHEHCTGDSDSEEEGGGHNHRF